MDENTFMTYYISNRKAVYGHSVVDPEEKPSNKTESFHLSEVALCESEAEAYKTYYTAQKDRLQKELADIERKLENIHDYNSYKNFK